MDAGARTVGIGSFHAGLESGGGGALRISGPVIFGIRPEDVYETRPSGTERRLGALSARVAAVEPLGAETLVMLRLVDSDEELIARFGRRSDLTPGATTTVYLDLGEVHLFDPASTEAIPDIVLLPAEGRA